MCEPVDVWTVPVLYILHTSCIKNAANGIVNIINVIWPQVLIACFL